MTKQEKLKRWLQARRRLGINVRQAADRLKVSSAMAYAWNCGDREIPPARVEQLEAMKS